MRGRTFFTLPKCCWPAPNASSVAAAAAAPLMCCSRRKISLHYMVLTSEPVACSVSSPLPWKNCDINNRSWHAPEPRCHEDCQHPQPPPTVSPLLPSSRVISSSIQLQAVLTHSSFCPDNTCARACVCVSVCVCARVSLRANFPLSHRHVKAYPPCLSPLTCRPVSVNTQLAEIPRPV